METKVLIVGHGYYASGLKSSLELLNGISEDVLALDFKEGDSFEDLSLQVENIVKNITTNWIILTDIQGGSPFKAAALSKMKYQNVQVCSGVNLPLLMEIVLTKNFNENIDELVKTAVTNCKESIFVLEL